MRLAVLILVIILVALLFCVTSIVNADVPTGYTYYKAHNITGSSDGALSDYQMKFIVHSGSGNDSGQDVFLNGHSLSWPNDIRFTNSNGSLLNYWIESYDSNNATFWVKVDCINAGQNSTLVGLYYGKSNESTGSNGSGTFTFFDDFQGSSLNLTKWASQPSDATVNNSVLSVNGNNAGNVLSKDTYGVGYALEFRMSITSTTQSDNFVGFFSSNPLCGPYTASFNTWGSGDWVYDGNYVNGDTRIPLSTSWTRFTSKRSPNGSSIGMINNSGNFIGRVDSSSYSISVHHYGNGVTQVDWVALRKNTQNGPQQGAWGAETSQPVASFTTNVTTGIAPLTVQFNDTSTGNPTNWTWNFGDNSSNETSQNITHIFQTTGNYTITLTASNKIGSNITAKTNYITVNRSIYNALYISNTTPTYQVVTGQPVAIDIIMQNTGEQSWHVETNQVNIHEIDGITQTQCNTPGSSVVITNMTNTFPVTVTVPSQPGNYTLQLQLYNVDNGQYVNFGPIVSIQLTVITASVGVAWIVNYTSVYYNNITYYNDTCWYTNYSAERLYNNLSSIGWQQSFDVGDTDVKASIFDINGLGGSSPYYVDDVDLAFWSGHGGHDGLCTTTDGTPILHIFYYAYFADSNWGGRLKWIGLDSCNGTEGGYGGVAGAMKGVHVVCGFSTHGGQVNPTMGEKWSYHMVKGTEPAENVTRAWFHAAQEVEAAGTVAQVWYGDQNCSNDYIWGQGPVASDPDPNAQKVPSQPYLVV